MVEPALARLVAGEAVAQRDRDTYEPAAPGNVPVLWQRPDPQQEPRGVVLPFRKPEP